MKTYWDLEAIGIKNDADDLEGLQIIDDFEKTRTKYNNRYQVSSPWKVSKYELSSNYLLAEARLKSLMKNFKDEQLKREYDEII